MPTNADAKTNHETDLRFWAAHPEKSGMKLAASDPLVPVWLAFNTVVKREVADGSIHWSGDPAPAAVMDPSTHPADQGTPHPAANAEIAMPDDFVGHGQPPGGVTTPAQADAGAEIQMPPEYVGKAPASPLTPPHVAVTGGHSHAAHPTAPTTRPAIDAATQAQLYAETNARFWAQTGYRPGQKLDSKKPADVAMMPVWNDVYKKVEAQWRAGTLQFTHDHPAVVAGISDAAHHAADAADHVNAATQATAAGDHAAAADHMDHAHGSHANANAAAATAAQVQPPTVSPVLVHHAKHQIQDFVMNGATGVATGPAREIDGDDVVAAMQGATAPAQAEAGASVAPAIQTAPASENGAAASIPSFPPTPAELGRKKPTSKGFPIVGAALAGAAAIGLGVFAFSQHRTQVRYRSFPRRH